MWDTPNQNDRMLTDCEEPPIAAHLLTPRSGFVHHGIYLGAGKKSRTAVLLTASCCQGDR